MKNNKLNEFSLNKANKCELQCAPNSIILHENCTCIYKYYYEE